MTMWYREDTIYLRSQIAISNTEICFFHDRFLIIDEETAYHIGASKKDAGKKCFGISRIEDAAMISDILQRLKIETEEVNN